MQDRLKEGLGGLHLKMGTGCTLQSESAGSQAQQGPHGLLLFPDGRARGRVLQGGVISHARQKFQGVQ